ncbi:MAG: acetyl-CoA carboxylase, biotin carboxyl carrier protein [Elusimicrobia bacterium]|nr:acetyl-CoA carboxylase, biotin carboxyl carrier protein [Candidatus Liberimonas magnetica]
MDQKEIKQFLVSFKNTDLEEVRFESDDLKIYFRKGEPEVIEPKVKAEEKKEITEEEIKVIPIKSPMVGTFFSSESNDHPPFVIEGNHVKPGQKIGIIEAMKIMKDVNSNLGGKIVKVFVKDRQPVEYGQELFLVDTEDVK